MYCAQCKTIVPDTNLPCPTCGNTYAREGQSAQMAKEKASEAVQDALHILPGLCLNPIGNLAVAYETLGTARALSVGLVFAGCFDFCLAFAVSQWNQQLLGGLMPGMEGGGGLVSFFKLLIVGIIPVLSMTAACALARKATHQAGHLAGDIFVAATALLPLALWLLLAAVLGMNNLTLGLALGVFAFCYTTNILYHGFTRIMTMSESVAAVAVPIVLLTGGWLTKVVLSLL